MKLQAIHADLHIFDERVKWAEPLRLALCFDDGSSIRLQVIGDGTMIADRLPLEGPFDMGEYGRVETFEITDRVDPTLRASPIRPLRVIHDDRECAIGVAVPRDDTGTFCIWADGDEFHWGNEVA